MLTRLHELEGIICKAAGITSKELREPNRAKELVDARHAIWLIAREHIGYSYQDLARYYNRDRTTIMHGINRLKQTAQHSELLKKLNERYPEITIPDPALAKKGIERWTF
jgi:chromosomal replication initiation ATPase DnaA